MTITIATEKVGRRIYVTGNSYAVKDRLKAAGCKWDPQRKQWWIGCTRRQKIEAIVGKLDGQEVKEDLSTKPLLGKAAYHGRDYYVLARTDKNGGRLWLTVLDEAIQFWAAESECRWIKTYDREYRQTTLDSIRRFVAEKKREEEEAKAARAKVAKTARGEPTRTIPRITDQRIIRGFFGERAVAYDYEVTQDEFDEYDNQAPGRYYGITVPASLADRWDAGIKACKAASAETRSREGLVIRYRIMAQDDAAELPTELAKYLAEKEAAEAAKLAAKKEAARKAAAEQAELDALLDGLVVSSVGPTSPAEVGVRIDGESHGHHMATMDPGDCTFGGEGMLRLSRGDTTYTEGRTDDGQRVVREDYRGYDDWRTYYHAPADVARAWALTYASQRHITPAKAREWLDQYDGCHGTDLYRAVADQEQS